MKSLALAVALAGCFRGPAAIAPVENTVPVATAPTAPVLKSNRGSGRVMQRTQTGGVITLVGDRGHALDDANIEMSAHCGPDSYTIVQEGEEPIGSAPTGRLATEWRVHYVCNGPMP